jgi:hypothetical protein
MKSTMTLLRSTLPADANTRPQPSTANQYSPDWWQRRREIDEWEQARRRACLVVHRHLVEDNFTPAEFGDPEPDRSVVVVPEYALAYTLNIGELAINFLGSQWCYLDEAIKCLVGSAAVNGTALPVEDLEAIAAWLMQTASTAGDVAEQARRAARALEDIARGQP